MKKLILIPSIYFWIAILSSCTEKSYCVSCISENNAGLSADLYEICSHDAGISNTYAATYTNTWKSKGYHVTCTKYISK